MLNERDYPYDPSHKLSEIRLYRGPDRVRWIPDRQLAQDLLDLWIGIQRREAKRYRPPSDNPQHWNEDKEDTE